MLLHNRIVYLGMPMVSAVTELIVAELLYLNYESPSKPVTLYINSPGTVNAQGQAVGFETEAFAIADCMKYIKPPVQTICVGQAFGAAAMLLAQGEKGKRFCLPNASIMLHQPRSQARGQASDIAIRAKEVMANRKVSCELMARACGRSVDEIMADASRTKYLQPDEAVEYGLVDKVLHNVGKAADAPKKPSRRGSVEALRGAGPGAGGGHRADRHDDRADRALLGERQAALHAGRPARLPAHHRAERPRGRRRRPAGGEQGAQERASGDDRRHGLLRGGGRAGLGARVGRVRGVRGAFFRGWTAGTVAGRTNHRRFCL